MKIVDVYAFYSPKGGGVRTYVDRKLIEGPRLGHEIVVIAPGPESRIEHRGPGARIIWLKSPRFILDGNYHYFADAAELHAKLDEVAPDVVEASSPWRSASMVADWRGHATRSLVMHADPLAAYAYRWFEMLADRPTIDRGFDVYWRHLRRLSQSFDTVISASESLSTRLRNGGIGGVNTLPMGVEPGVFSPAHRQPALRAQLLDMCGLGNNAVLLAGVGRHAPEKRWPMIIEAVTAAQYSTPIGLVLIGDGRERSRLVRQIGNNPHIQLLAPIADRQALAAIMASADALVHGCEAETFCMVAAEAAASGLPLIAPDQGGASDQAKANGGRCFRSGSAADAARVILDFARSDLLASRPMVVAGASRTRTMQAHFADLFQHYDDARRSLRSAA